MERTNSAGTPFFDRASQYQTWDCVVPIWSAKGFWPPATSQARANASRDMTPYYPKLGISQPKNLSRSAYLKFDSADGMEKIDAKAYGRRVKQRREDLGLTQEELAAQSGQSQSNIDWIEAGRPKKPEKTALALIGPLMTSVDWLLHERGPKHIGPEFLTIEQLVKVYKSLTPLERSEISAEINEFRRIPRPPRKKAEK